jgi:hypothetical protein
LRVAGEPFGFVEELLEPGERVPARARQPVHRVVEADDLGGDRHSALAARLCRARRASYVRGRPSFAWVGSVESAGSVGIRVVGVQSTCR